MSANLYPNELQKAAKLVEEHQVPADTELHFWRPGPVVVILEWLEDDPTAPMGKRWRRFDITTGEEVKAPQPISQ